MEIFKSKDVTHTVIYMIVFTVLIVIFTLITITDFEKIYISETNGVVVKLANVIKEKYPDIDDVEIVNILRDEETYDKNVLEKYGYFDEQYISRVKVAQEKYKKIAITSISVLGIGLISAYMIYLKRQNKKLQELGKYLHDINNKNYSLKIDENTEDEMSRLRNELYKTTVFLKENAELSSNEKVAMNTVLIDISHQLKTPLTSILILLDNINQNENMDSATKKDFINEITKQVEWMNTLVISLLKIAKFDAGVIKFEKVKVSIPEFLNSILESLDIMLDVKNIEVVKNVEDGELYIDPKWQKEAITNILKNAIEHSKKNSKIYINVVNNSLFVKIKIRDEGEGIDEKDKKHIFERFFKSKKSCETSVGVGLNLAKTIIEKENGTVGVESEVGVGTTFTVTYVK